MKQILTLLLLILLTEAFGEEVLIKQKVVVIIDEVEVVEVYDGFSDTASEYSEISDVKKKSFCYTEQIEAVCPEVLGFATDSRKSYDEGTSMDLMDGVSCKVISNKVLVSYMLSNDETHEPFFVEKEIIKCD